ncbi:hypothetical protein SLEP1_g11019 [Rubroshorea leprosula]|uniref:RING-type E3 ubiquitin transferase n=1 Tax=Rubroshorea leprosula TaxID=152421 RepID=A0AAV5IJZ0_9ROSI|nr:hypothetical protein SLEP1_g11019 [Rubroshorea leprosula]
MDVRFQHRKLMSNTVIIVTSSNACAISCNNSSCSSPNCWEPPPSNDLPSGPKMLLILTFTVLATTFLALCCYIVYVKYYLRGSRGGAPPQTTGVRSIRDDFADEDRGSVLDHPIWYIRTVGLQPSVISSIAVFKYKKGDGLVEGTECSVCLSEFQEDENLRLLPKCNHAFHLPCIDTWFRSHTNCPLCRAPIVSNTAASSLPEVNGEESIAVEESRMGVLEESEVSEGEPVVESSEVRIGIDEEEETPVQDTEQGIQPMRRSVSLDSLAASKISRAISNSENQSAKYKESRVVIVPRRLGGSRGFLRFMGSSSFGRTLQSGPVVMKRSSSCNEKFSLPRCGKNRNTDLPVRSF